MFCFPSTSSANVDGEDSTVEVQSPIPSDQWNEDTKVWLARSCVGEAGFHAVEECMGIAWTYATRYKRINKPSIKFETFIKQYSAALKSKFNVTRTWVMGLRIDGKRPSGWPNHLDWKSYAPHWETVLSSLDSWAIGLMPNPVEGADHFGGPMDKNVYNWQKINPVSSVHFRNRFYKSFSDCEE